MRVCCCVELLELIVHSTGVISLKKVKFNSRLETDWLNNWKLFATSFKLVGIDKVRQVASLNN